VDFKKEIGANLTLTPSSFLLLEEGGRKGVLPPEDILLTRSPTTVEGLPKGRKEEK